MSNHDIGHGIMVRRAMLRMSQARLAKAIGVGQSYISLIEHNERPLTEALRQKISAVLGCKPEELSREFRAWSERPPDCHSEEKSRRRQQ